MPYEKQIVCLANSKKHAGRCVAGIEVSNGRLGSWIRPVSARDGEELAFDDRRYDNGQDVQLLDLITIRFLEPKPHSCQVENHLIDDTFTWQKVGVFPAKELLPVCGNDPILWLDGGSSYNGTGDRIAEEAAHSVGSSLRLVAPNNLVIRVAAELNNKRKVRAAFSLGSCTYVLAVTDTKVETRYLAMSNGEYRYPCPAVMCISLGEPFNGFRYKLVASIIDL
jgi:hypothetical protein